MKIIKYKLLSREVNNGTAEEPNIEPIFLDVEMDWNEVNEETAKKEAYNGEYTIEDNGQPEPIPEPTVWDDLDAAYQAGYHEGYTEGVNSAYDQ